MLHEVDKENYLKSGLGTAPLHETEHTGGVSILDRHLSLVARSDDGWSVVLARALPER